jgi:sugar phosphate isomerase/epimerase
VKASLHPVILGGGLSFEDQVKLASRHGFLGVDTGIDAIAKVIEERSLPGAKELFAEHNVQPACWGLTVNWQAPADEFAAGLAALPDKAKIAQEIGCTRCLMWISPSTDEDPAALRKLAVARFGECAKVLNDYGSRLGLEWVGPKTSRTRKHDFIYRMDQVLDMEADMGQPNLGLLVDSFHWFTAHHTVADLEALPAEKVVHVHLNDAPDKPRDEQIDMERLLPGEGVIDLKGFLGALKRTGYPDYMGVETFSKVLPTLPPDESAAEAKAAVDKVMAGV